MFQSARENLSNKSTIDTSKVWASGTFKNVYLGSYTSGPRSNQPCVCKVFKSGSVYADSYFDNEIKVVEKSLQLLDRFNKQGFISKKIWMNRPTIWEFKKDGEKNLVEPLIRNFEKFNSNTGWTPRDSDSWGDVMQALSHYSYHTSNRNLLLCDLQGGIYRDGFIITDPVIMSQTREYGPADLGDRGIENFFAYHECNSFCKSNWLQPHYEPEAHFNPRHGTTMRVPTRQSRPPLTYHHY